MRTIIAGSRSVDDYEIVKDAVSKSGITPTTILSGNARGVDRLGERWAAENSVPLETYPAEWEKHGKAAGYIRNAEMVTRAAALIAIWDGSSRGTEHVIELARQRGLRVHVRMVARDAKTGE